MKVLWFPGNGAIYASDNKYNGGGWTGALARELIAKHPEMDLAMAIPWKDYFEDQIGGVKIYGIPTIKLKSIGYQRKLKSQILVMRQIVDKFQPDIIHVFGSEHTGGMVASVTKIPVVLHLQGIMNFLYGAWLPQNMSWGKYIRMCPKHWNERAYIQHRCSTEKSILNSCKFLMGRTEMDKRVSAILSPDSKYFYCSEMLRPEIYHSPKIWTYHDRSKKIIVSVISAPIYKGGDVILRTAKILKEDIAADFEWKVYGVKDMKVWEKLCGIKAKDVNICICGIINAVGLVDAVTDADVFVHPSYIENSPNTVCEAQVLGIPVIANHVGGVSSLIKHMENGILLPANDPYMSASYVSDIFSDKNLATRIGTEGRKVAINRHNPNTIVNDVMNVYYKILKQ
ncbi:glycosyltransferase family 4 protein [Xylanibacter ruminicola]|uniref:Glycosyltransferase, group 1 family n=1 Tax=Xylanibacter ruminicola (strain ATCC 19189 / DSM 19721 / CIP 105475 / JCM 8958 / 23) TaxID=264731 RepID=D5ETV0_XYLR2|nr:glycosyltransferase [Xylanibacter ruminicola]ADE81716.1 glycosyltransferase, group 1 family [Xylanibacter ruminicola 23]